MLSSLSALLDVLKDKLRTNWELDSKGLMHRDEPWAVGRWDKETWCYDFQAVSVMG